MHFEHKVIFCLLVREKCVKDRTQIQLSNPHSNNPVKQTFCLEQEWDMEAKLEGA